MVSAAASDATATSADRTLNGSGLVAADSLRARHGYNLRRAEIVPDDTQLIRQSIPAWASDAACPTHLLHWLGARDAT